MTLARGTHLASYEILAPLGAGGMGEVYRARDTRLGREVAVKVLPERLADDPAAQARLEREAKAVAALSHPNLLAIHDVGTDRGVYFAVMELLEGETLRSRMLRSALPWRKTVQIAAAVADGMAAAHAKGIIHRDLKPENIFITTDGVVKILDFGLAKLGGMTTPAEGGRGHAGDVPGDDDAIPTQTLDTQPGTVMGTVHYMSPEQVRGGRVDARSDIFSFGAVLYEMVTGQRAFARPTAPEIMTAILREEPPEMGGTGVSPVSVPPELRRIIGHCLEKNPEDRFQSARDLAFDLRAVLAQAEAARLLEPQAPAWGLPTRRWRSGLGWLAASVVALAVIAGALLALNVSGWRDKLLGRSTSIRAPSASAGSARIESLAVLPLENLSGDPAQEYFADGMTEALISDLGQIRALRVISRHSAMRYKGVRKPTPQIARELNVDAVLEGSVQRSPERVLIRVALVYGATDRQLWSTTYAKEPRDVLALQSEVARAVAQEIQVQLTPQEQTRLATAPPVNPEAYELYLRGRYYWNKRTAEGFKKAIEYFQQAIEKDPGYTLAYSGLADTYSMAANWWVLPPADAYPKARAAAYKALELNDMLAEAHASLAGVMWTYEHNWSGAEAEYRKAIELNPSYAMAHLWYALMLVSSSRGEEGLAEMARARQLDPLSLAVNMNLGWILYVQRRYDQAIAELRKTLDLDPHFEGAGFWLGVVYGQKGMHQEAIAELEKVVDQSKRAPDYVAYLAHAYALAGRDSEARELLRALDQLSEQEYVPAYCTAVVYLGLGETDRAFEFLEKAYEEYDGSLFSLNVDPVWDRLRSDPRFDDLLRRIGLEPKGALPTPPVPASGASEIDPGGVGMPHARREGEAPAEPRSDDSRGSAGASPSPAGEKLRITAKLIQASDQTQLWSQDYDRTLADVFSEGRFVSPYLLAMVYAGLGEKDRALECLEKGFTERDAGMAWLARDPMLDPLHEDPRFDDLLRHIGLGP